MSINERVENVVNRLRGNSSQFLAHGSDDRASLEMRGGVDDGQYRHSGSSHSQRSLFEERLGLGFHHGSTLAAFWSDSKSELELVQNVICLSGAIWVNRWT